MENEIGEVDDLEFFRLERLEMSRSYSLRIIFCFFFDYDDNIFTG